MTTAVMDIPVKSKSLSVRYPPHVIWRAQQLADEEGVSLGTIIRELAAEGLAARFDVTAPELRAAWYQAQAEALLAGDDED